MITVLSEETQTEYFGLSSDKKPENQTNGDSFTEVDTGKVYLYDEEHHVWLLQEKKK